METRVSLKYFVSYCNYEEELEAITMATENARDNFSLSNDSLYIFPDCQSAILAVTSRNRENYHNSTVRVIHQNPMDIV